MNKFTPARRRGLRSSVFRFDMRVLQKLNRLSRFGGGLAVLWMTAAIGVAESSGASFQSPRATAHSAHTQSAHQSLAAVWPISPQVGWVFTQDFSNLHGGPQAIDRTTDGGVTWTNVTPLGMIDQGGNHYIFSLFALSANDAWVTWGDAGGSRSSTVATFNGGHSWHEVGRTSQQGCQVQFVSREKGWCADNEGAGGSALVTIYRTVDGGSSWSRIFENGVKYPTAHGSLPFNCDKEMEFTPSDVAWAMFDCNGPSAPLYESLNGGVTWINRTVNVPRKLFGGGAAFDGTPVLEGLRGAVGCTYYPVSFICVSSDGGRSFQVVKPPGKGTDWNVDVITPEQWKLVQGDRVLSTMNGGRSWSAVVDNEHFDLNAGLSLQSPVTPSVHFVSDDVGWLVDGYTSLLRTTDGGKIWNSISIPGLPVSK